jgi:hypothetical protein
MRQTPGTTTASTPLTHTDEVVAVHGVLIAFGAGDGAQTTPETDGGKLIVGVNAYAEAAGELSCP